MACCPERRSKEIRESEQVLLASQLIVRPQKLGPDLEIREHMAKRLLPGSNDIPLLCLYFRHLQIFHELHTGVATSGTMTFKQRFHHSYSQQALAVALRELYCRTFVGCDTSYHCQTDEMLKERKFTQLDLTRSQA